MAKRGQRLPWKVRYQYEGRPAYVVACSTEWDAQHKAEQIRANADTRELVVVVDVYLQAAR